MSLVSRINALATRIATEVKAKQALLVSGTNIKTVNNTSLLGSGNIEISGGSGTTVEVSVAQTSHGLSVGDAIRVSGENTFAKAQANSSANAEVIGFISVVTDANNFKYVSHGYVTTGVPTATAGTVYFLDPTTAGALTATEPTTTGLISKPLLIVLESAAKALILNLRGLEITTAPTSTVGEIWTSISGVYASTSTFTFSGVDRDTYLIKKSLFTCTDSTGATRKFGYIKSAINSTGTITVTVVSNVDLASGDKDFKVTYNRKLNDYAYLLIVPGECIADTSYSQGGWLDKLADDSYLLPVDAGVQTAAAGSGAALTYNIYKNSTALFGTAPDLTTNTSLNEQRPTTNTISATETVTLRIMSSAGATNKAADFQVKLYIVPQVLFLSI